MPGRTRRTTERSFKAGARFAIEGKFDSFVSVGGGPVMDTCKAANLYSTYPPDHFFAYVNALIGEALDTVPRGLRLTAAQESMAA